MPRPENDDGLRVAVLTVMRGELDLLPAMQQSVAWADEHHLVETAPDATATRDQAGDAMVHHHPLPPGASFEDARAAAMVHITSPWVLIVDTDERIPATLATMIRTRLSQWDSEGIAGVWIARRNHVLHAELDHSSAWPDYQLRLVRREAVHFSPILHHAIQLDGRDVQLEAEPGLALEHRAFRSTEQYMAKVNQYSSLEAAQATDAAASTPGRAVLAAMRDFGGRYVHMQGFRDGRAGLHYAVVMAMYRYLTVAKQWERRLGPQPGDESGPRA